MTPLPSINTQALAARERKCYNCSGKMTSQGIRNGLYIYLCTACHNSFEIYEPK
jgi:hypothetical protein